jgi:hypothetical protein
VFRVLKVTFNVRYLVQSLTIPRNSRSREVLISFLIFYLFICISYQFAQEYQGRESAFSEPNALQPADSGSGTTIRSSYFTILLEPDVNLKRVLSRINIRSFYTPAGRRVNSLAGMEERIGYRMDLILEQVKKVLDIYPVSTDIKVKIFKRRKDLQDEYCRITMRRSPVRSFYVHQYHTIYTSEADINDSVVAHEMGHAVVDHFFQAMPSEKVGEMLATYVDLHLED